jgi:kynurenine formamidase
VHVTDHEEPSNDDVRDYLEGRRRNWGRWGEDDEVGALNLLTAERRLAGIRSVRSGDVLSLARPLATWVGAGNPLPMQHFIKMGNHGGDNRIVRHDRPRGGSGTDYYGMPYHGVTTTHLDALSHAWDAEGTYGGRQPEEIYTFDGVTFGGIQHWATGILARAVLLDVPRFRGTEYVTQDRPVQGWELEAILDQDGITVSPGDAVCVYSGRERWQLAHPATPYGRSPIIMNTNITGRGYSDKPGLHASCLPFLRDRDLSTLVWDMLDATPYPYDVTYTVHGAIHAYGMALIDNAILEPLANECARRGQYEFLLVVSPLVVEGGTGSPVNPLAVL